MSSQSVAVAPSTSTVASSCAVPESAKNRAESPLSLCTHQTPGLRRLAAMPDASVSEADDTVPASETVAVLAQTASSSSAELGAAPSTVDPGPDVPLVPVGSIDTPGPLCAADEHPAASAATTTIATSVAFRPL